MNTGAVLFNNNASSRLKIDIPAASPTITVEEGAGVKFPQPAGDGSNWFIVTVEDRRTGQVEIMECTQRAGDILTVTRAQEGTVAQDFVMGASVSNRLTAGTMATFFEFNGYSMPEADDRFINAAGDEMFGPLILPAEPPTDPEHAANKQYVDDVSIDEAPIDGRAYARSLEDWIPIGTGIAEAPNDTKLYGRGQLDWHETVPIGTFEAEVAATDGEIAAINDHLVNVDATNDAQDLAISDNTSANALQDTAISALQTTDVAHDDALASLDGRMDSAEAGIDSNDTRLDAVEAKNTTQDTRLTAVEGVNTTQDGRLTAVEGINTTQNGRLDAVEAMNTAQDAAIATKIGDAPSDGLVYGRKNAAWATVIGGAATDDNPPAGPLQDGQLWWQSSTGNTFIWYVDADGGQWVQQNVSQLAASGQVGEVVYFARDTAPVGFLVCNGASYTTAAQPILFAAIGYRFGGSGLNFNVPQLLGEFIRGWDNGRGIDAARVFGSAQDDALQNITGSFDLRADNSGGDMIYAAAGAMVLGNAGSVARLNTVFAAAATATRLNFSAASSPSARTSTETRPRNVALLPCIRYLPTVEGIAPDALPMPVFKGARVKMNADKALVSATVTQIIWDAEMEDVGDWWSAAAPTLFTVPAGVTRVRCIGSGCFNGNAAGLRQITIYKNGGAMVPSANTITQGTTSATQAITDSGWLPVVAGDTFSLGLYQNIGSNLNALASGCWFAIEAYPGQ